MTRNEAIIHEIGEREEKEYEYWQTREQTPPLNRTPDAIMELNRELIEVLASMLKDTTEEEDEMVAQQDNFLNDRIARDNAIRKANEPEPGVYLS